MIDRGPTVPERARYISGYTTFHPMSREDAEAEAARERAKSYVRPGSVEVREEKP